MPDPQTVTKDKDPQAELRRMLEEQAARTERAEKAAADARDRAVRAETLASQTPPAAKPEPPKEHSREELQRLVDGGSLTEARMQEILDQQRERKVLAQVDERMSRAREAEQRATAVSSELEAYQAARPDAWTDGSDARKAVQREFDHLVKLNGAPRDKVEQQSYEVMALRAAFGPPVKETTRSTRPTHVETGGGAGDETEETQEGAPAKLRDRSKLRFHYKQMIDRGYYSGWDDPKLVKELEFV